MTFWVTVVYVEPTYAAREGKPVAPYRWTFEIEARDSDDALARAKARFRRMAQDSSVGWIREIVSWDVTEATPPENA